MASYALSRNELQKRGKLKKTEEKNETVKMNDELNEFND